MEMYYLNSRNDMQEALLMELAKTEIICNQLASKILVQTDVSSRIEQMKILRDVAESCTSSTILLANFSHFTKDTLALTAKICESCGIECSQYMDIESQKCAQVCFNCALECVKYNIQMK